MNFLATCYALLQEMSIIKNICPYVMSISSIYHFRGPSGAVEVIGHLLNALFHYQLCQFFRPYSRIPHCAPTKFKSSIAIPSPVKILNNISQIGPQASEQLAVPSVKPEEKRQNSLIFVSFLAVTPAYLAVPQRNLYHP